MRLTHSVIGALLCTFFLEIQGVPKYLSSSRTYSTTIFRHFNNISTVISDHDLLIFNKGKKNECKISNSDPNYHIRYKLHAMAKPKNYNHNVFVLVWGVRDYKYTNNISNQTNVIIIVNLTKCLLLERHTFTEEVNGEYLLDAQVIEDSNRFNVYLPSLKICTPCSFEFDSGTQMATNPDKLPPDAPENADLESFYIRNFQDSSRKEFYLISYNLKNGGSILRLTNEYFKIQKERISEHTIEAITLKHMNRDEDHSRSLRIGICYRKKAEKKILCEMLNWELLTAENVKLEVPIVSDFVSKILDLKIDSQNKIFITLYQTRKNLRDGEPHSELSVYYSQIVHDKCKTKKVHISEIERKISNILPFTDTNKEGVGEFCVALSYGDMHYNNVSFDIKCNKEKLA